MYLLIWWLAVQPMLMGLMEYNSEEFIKYGFSIYGIPGNSSKEH